MKVNVFLDELRKEITPEIRNEVDMSFRIAIEPWPDMPTKGALGDPCNQSAGGIEKG